MKKQINICICGGGSLSHVCAGFLASQNNISVNILTQHPEKWSKSIVVTDLHDKEYKGDLKTISSNPEEAVKDCHIILLCLPGFAIEDTLLKIKPFVSNTIVGSIVCSTGFFFNAHTILGDKQKLFGFQRVPFIARTKKYGESASLLGYKKQIAIACENIDDTEQFRKFVKQVWSTETKLLHSYLEASLTNSNPILHTGRLYSMWKNWNGECFDHNILFYEDWTEDASETVIKMDREFMSIIDVLPIEKSTIAPLLEYYESFDAKSLTEKIKSIEAFHGITSPMLLTAGGWIPDFTSRYFTEDFPFGLRYILEIAKNNNIPVPFMTQVYEWGMGCINYQNHETVNNNYKLQ